SAPETRWRLLAGTTASLQHLVALASAAASLLAPLAIALASPTSYDHGSLITVAAILPFGAVIYVSYLSSVHVLFQQGRTTALAWITPSSAMLSLALCAALVRPLGLAGAALATIVGYTVQALGVRRASSRLATVPWDHRSTVGAFVMAA